MKWEHLRVNVVSTKQHLLKHKMTDFLYSHPSLPSNVNNMQEVTDWILNVLYPKNRPSVATVGDLPSAGNESNDYRIVNDDGDGNPAGYLWAKWDGDATAEWHKVSDFDWGINDIIQGVNDTTQPWYVSKYGRNDADENGVEYTGELSGQRIFGGTDADTNLILFANNGDLVGNTGFIQLGDDTKPLTDSVFNLGEDTYRFLNGFFDTIHAGTSVITSGSITDTSGQISFGDENLITTGTLASGEHTIGTLTLNSGSITDSSGDINFGSTNLSTTGASSSSSFTAGTTTFSSGSILDSLHLITFGSADLDTLGHILSGDGNIFGQTIIDDLDITSTTISPVAINTDLIFSTSGTGIVHVTAPLETLGISSTGTVNIAGSCVIDNITIDGSTVENTAGTLVLDSTTNILVGSPLLPSNANQSLGDTVNPWGDLYIDGLIGDGTDVFLISNLLDLKNANYRDSARTLPVQVGDALFWTGTEWLASNPDSEIIHNELSGLTDADAGHTQFALLVGRSGGQTLNGGTILSEMLSLGAYTGSDTINILEDNISPSVNGTFDIGTSLYKFDDLYMTGEAFGIRAENDTTAGITSKCSALTAGRLFFSTTDNFLYTDIGGSPKKVGQNSYNGILTNVELQSPIDVSGSVDDARNCIWQLSSISDSYEILYVDITKTQTTVIVTVATPLPSGNYKLLGIEV